MIRLIRFVLSIVLLLCVVAAVSAQTNSTDLTFSDIVNSLVGEEGRKRRRKHEFGYHLWWWGLKALSVLITVKIKVILLFLFLGGGIFYGLKVWQGTALGCPEPIIQEVKHHDHDVLPYHSHFSSPDISYSAPPPDAYYGGYSSGSYSGGDYSGVYSNTPSYPAPSGVFGTQPTAPAGVVDTSSSAGVANAYLPPSSRRRRVSGNARAISDSTSSMVTDLFFRFLGVNSDVCKRRFVCELEFRNPIVGYAMNYLGNDLFKDYRLPKESLKTPKKFADCAKLYAECEVPKEHTFAVKKRRRYFRRKPNQTATVDEEEITTVSPDVEATDLVTKYVKNQE